MSNLQNRSIRAPQADSTGPEDSGSSGPPEAETSFEHILERLETIAAQLDHGDTALEEALALFEEGVRLSKVGNARLDGAERKIEMLLQSGETRSLEADAGDRSSMTSSTEGGSA